VVGHSGITIGQGAFLRIVPSRDLAGVLLTNGGRFRELDQVLTRQVFHDLAGVEMPAPLTPQDPRRPVDVTPYAGTYRRAGERLEVWQDADTARLRSTTTLGIDGVDQEAKELELTPVDDGLFAVREPGEQIWTPVKFYTLADGPHTCTTGITPLRRWPEPGKTAVGLPAVPPRSRRPSPPIGRRNSLTEGTTTPFVGLWCQRARRHSKSFRNGAALAMACICRRARPASPSGSSPPASCRSVWIDPGGTAIGNGRRTRVSSASSTSRICSVPTQFGMELTYTVVTKRSPSDRYRPA
jgi:hypothetical protein